ncbi:MAG: hypothetical protein IIW59_04100, partial [Alistipes sp.]|nr:hypothetical protein [Alistipes sp.]
MKRTVLMLIFALLCGAFSRCAQPDKIEVMLYDRAIGEPIADDYCGLSYETRIVLPDTSGTHYFSPENKKLVNMFKTLGIKSLRLGGNSVDVAATPTPSANDLDALFGFAREAGVKVIYSVRLKDGSIEAAVNQTRYIWENYADLLDYFAIGNEPGYYKNYEEQYQPRWDALLKAMQQVAPEARFCAPDDNPNPVLCQKLIRDYWQQPLSLITLHNYPAGCAFTNPGSGRAYEELIPFEPAERCEYLLSDSLPKVYAEVARKMEQVVEGYPFRLSETSNFWYGGLEGASSAYAAALWGVEYMYWWASRGCLGMNFHTGDNAGGIPIKAHYAAFVTEGEAFDVRPLSYAVKLFDIGAKGRLLPVEVSDNRRFAAYAAKQESGVVCVTLINKAYDGKGERVVELRFDEKSPRIVEAETLVMACADG